MGEETEVLEKTEETDTKKAPETPDGRKLYKGEVLKVEDLAKQVGASGVAPIQPMTRKYKVNNFEQSLPPSFVVTKFVRSYAGNYSMHYFNPANGQKAYREVPPTLELNLLKGKRGQELDTEWHKAVKEKLPELTHRVACTIGADPEVFVVAKDGSVLPAWEYMPGKNKPLDFRTSDGAFTGTAYWDGFQAEFTTQAGITCLMQMGDIVQAGLQKIMTTARAKNPKAKLTLASVVQVSDEVLASAKEEHVQFGCAPSYNVYGLQGNTTHGRQVPYRFAGGHIHFGLRDGGGVWDKERIVRAVRVLDSVLGVACVSMFANQDNPVRRQFYGQPGEYRLPPHGLEYRTLSNAWLAHPLIFQMVFDLARAAAGLADEGLGNVWDATENETVEIIMNHEVDRARAILKRNESVFKGIIRSIGGSYMPPEAADVAYRIWLGGMEEAVADPSDIEGNWNLSKAWYAHSSDKKASFGTAYIGLGQKKKF